MSEDIAFEQARLFWARHQELYCSYADLYGRSSRYLRDSELPPMFLNPDRWPTHVPGVRWHRCHLLDILSQLFIDLPPRVPRHGWACFEAHYLTALCMPARRVRQGWPD